MISHQSLEACIHRSDSPSTVAPGDFADIELVALEHMWLRGYVHRDVSAANVLIIDGHGVLVDLDYAKTGEDLRTVRSGCVVLAINPADRFPSAGHSCLHGRRSL